MPPEKYQIWLADLNPRFGMEPGKVRPVVVVQSNLLNTHHPSTLVCPLSTQVLPELNLLRVHIQAGEAGLERTSDILVDQLRAIDNQRLLQLLGTLGESERLHLDDNLRLVLDL